MLHRYLSLTVVIENRVNPNFISALKNSKREECCFLVIISVEIQPLLPFSCSPIPVLSSQFIPMPVLYGVFLYMGVASLNGVQVSDSDPKCSLKF